MPLGLRLIDSGFQEQAIASQIFAEPETSANLCVLNWAVVGRELGQRGHLRHDFHAFLKPRVDLDIALRGDESLRSVGIVAIVGTSMA